MHARAVQYSTIYTHLYILNSFTKSEVQNLAYGKNKIYIGKNGGSRAQRFLPLPISAGRWDRGGLCLALVRGLTGAPPWP